MADPEVAPGRRYSWATYVYYYLGALVGLIVVVTGLIAIADGIMDALFPPETAGFTGGFAPIQPIGDSGPFGEQDRIDGLREALSGLLIALIGVAVLVWHLNEARRREGDPDLRLPFQKRSSP